MHRRRYVLTAPLDAEDTYGNSKTLFAGVGLWYDEGQQGPIVEFIVDRAVFRAERTLFLAAARRRNPQ
jgi:hypothetical protein